MAKKEVSDSVSPDSSVQKRQESSKVPLKNEHDIAMDFAIRVHRKFGDMVKATVLFGSQAKNTATPESDIDIVIIIDDATIKWDLELVSWYREELANLISSCGYNKELHINTIKITTWWQDLMYGDPVVLNILRYGEALVDLGGFFNPVKALLIDGKIRSTPEAVYAALQRAPEHLVRSRLAVQGAIEGIYWTLVDSSQAALITAGKMPPSPEHIPEYLKDTFVDTDMLKMDQVRFFNDIFSLHKSISHGNSHDIRGSEIDKWQVQAEKFLGQMTDIINKILEYKDKQ